MSNNTTITVYTTIAGIKSLEENKCCNAKLQKDDKFKYPINVPINSLKVNWGKWNGGECNFDEGQEIEVNLRSS